MSNLNDELPSTEPVLKIPARPQDVNMYGDIFGGWLMSQADMAAGMRARERALGRVATRAVSEFEFLKPVKVGDLVLVYAEVGEVGTSSVTVDVEVYVERHSTPYSHIIVQKVAVARLVFVAVESDGSKRRIPPA
jgi:acyl-CoA thioesterase YciA